MWVGLRLVQISTMFKSAFGENAINATDPDSRVRPLFEWQCGGGWSDGLTFIADVYGAQHPVDYYLYGGGGTWYSSVDNYGFSDVSFVNPSFANGMAGWTTTGAAGVVANGSSLGNFTAPPLFAAISVDAGATESGNTVTITTTTTQCFLVGQSVKVSGVTSNGYNGTFTIISTTATSLTYRDTISGLPASGDGIVTGTTGSTQTAYLQPGASISQNVTFSGGYADITLYGAQTVPGDGYHGVSITLTPINGGPSINNGQPIGTSEGPAQWTNINSRFAWDRSQAFYTGNGDYTYTVTITSTLSSGTAFVDNFGIQTVNGIFNEAAPAVANGGENISSSIQADVNLGRQYGLFDVGYEGGLVYGENMAAGWTRMATGTSAPLATAVGFPMSECMPVSTPVQCN